jgi:hypothetical protein
MTIINTPSGMQVDVRGLSIRDGRYLSKPELYQDNQIEDLLIESCCLRVVEPGPYKMVGDGKLEWGKTIIGDRLGIVFGIRIASYPDLPYSIALRCPVTHCREKFDWDVDLDLFMRERMQSLPEATKQLMIAGKPCEVTIPKTDKKLRFFLKTADDRRAWLAWRKKMKTGTNKQRDRFNDITHALLYWNVEIDGIERREIDQKLDFLETLSLAQGVELRQLMDMHDCGLNTTVEVKCPYCAFAWEIELPFNQDFFLPPTLIGRSKAETQMTTSKETKKTLEIDPLELEAPPKVANG